MRGVSIIINSDLVVLFDLVLKRFPISGMSPKRGILVSVSLTVSEIIPPNKIVWDVEATTVVERFCVVIRGLSIEDVLFVCASLSSSERERVSCPSVFIVGVTVRMIPVVMYWTASVETVTPVVATELELVDPDRMGTCVPTVIDAVWLSRTMILGVDRTFSLFCCA